jgi:hypothetical protein
VPPTAGAAVPPVAAGVPVVVPVPARGAVVPAAGVAPLPLLAAGVATVPAVGLVAGVSFELLHAAAISAQPRNRLCARIVR